MWKKIILGIVAGLVILGGYIGYTLVKNKGADYNDNLYLVNYVIDGDTFKVNDDVRVRLLGIDSPEKGECYYEESREFLIDLIEGKYVRLEKDISGKDDYGRLLRYAILVNKDDEEDNILVNDRIVRLGYALAVSSPPDNRYRQLLSAAQEEALREERGLWAACDYEREYEALRQKDYDPPNEDCIIKGNISERGYGKVYFLPGCDNYEKVKIDFSRGEKYFCSEEEAIEAGFKKATNCP
ncbi:MAG: hypothetical protein GF387_03280 [Candidatus Portnoybacteria bacterium]|nr:hypothetical protein [Candidatus Portnoybacteria bacterium]